MLPAIILSGVLFFTFFDRGGVPFLSHAVLIGGLFVAALGLLFRRSKEEGRIFIGLPEIFFVGYAVFFYISWFFSKTPTYGLTEFFSAAGALLLFLLFSTGIIGKKEASILKNTFLFFMLATLLFGFYVYILLPFDRFTGPFVDFQKPYNAYPNSMASILLFTIPLFTVFFFRASEWLMKLGYAALLVLSVSAFILTFSRGAFLAFLGAAVMTAALWVVIAKEKRSFSHYAKNAVCILVLFAASVALSAGIMLARSHFQTLLNLSDRANLHSYGGGSAVAERLEFWRGSLELIREYPLFGTGPASFKFFFPQQQQTFGIIQDHPHNIFLEIATENGVMALGFYILFLLAVFVSMIQLLRGSSNRSFVWAVLFAFTALVLNKITDDHFNFVAITLLFYSMLGWAVAESRPFIHTKISLHHRSFVVVVFLFASVLGFLSLHETWYSIPLRQGKTLVESGEFEKGLEKFRTAEKLFWPRDLAQNEAHAYGNFYISAEKNQLPEIRTQWHKLLERGFFNDPELMYSAALLAEYEGQLTAAENFYRQALAADNKNFLKYHYGYNRIRLRKNEYINREELRQLITTYTDLLSKNGHFTAVSENPDYANRLYILLFESAMTAQEKQQLLAEHEAFRKIWLKRKSEMEQRFGL